MREVNDKENPPINVFCSVNEIKCAIQDVRSGQSSIGAEGLANVLLTKGKIQVPCCDATMSNRSFFFQITFCKNHQSPIFV